MCPSYDLIIHLPLPLTNVQNLIETKQRGENFNSPPNFCSNFNQNLISSALNCNIKYLNMYLYVAVKTRFSKNGFLLVKTRFNEYLCGK